MQIKCRADSAPEKERQHDRQIGKVKAREEPNQAEQLKSDQDKKNAQLNLFAFKHAAQGQEQPTGPQLKRESAQSDKNEQGASRYFLKPSHNSEGSVRLRQDKQIAYATHQFLKICALVVWERLRKFGCAEE